MSSPPQDLFLRFSAGDERAKPAICLNHISLLKFYRQLKAMARSRVLRLGV